ncbi:fimbrial protein [Pantoea sp. A4]|uniref:fimbrial protein n=1 Tax=Pantoea sp. A4 TaxID=1225184 RepID=UPI00035E23B9|nr:fimbrial protein [Pantoea sp. A4]
MNLNAKMMALLVAMGISGAVNAANTGSGTVTFTGAIIDAPCSINPNSVDQTVNLGQISNAELATDKNTGTSTPQPFYIKLENCTTATLKSVQSTFTGPKSLWDADSLGINGSAEGASIILKDGSGAKIKLGEKTTAQALQDGNNTLSYSAYLQGGGSLAVIKPGNFQTVSNFTLSYQ